MLAGTAAWAEDSSAEDRFKRHDGSGIPRRAGAETADPKAESITVPKGSIPPLYSAAPRDPRGPGVSLRESARLLLLAFAALAAACDGGPETSRPREPRSGGTLVIGSISDVDAWNEYVSRQTFANNLHRRIWLRLAQEQSGSKNRPAPYAPQLAESWEIAPDGRSIAFRLREAAWSDGTPITASDVRFTWTAQRAPEVAWVNATTKARIVDVETPDPRTAVFRFDRAYPGAFADAVEGGILPRHLFEAVPFGSWRTFDWSAAAKVGSGPFLLERHRSQEEIVLARNPRYLDGSLPRVDRVVVRVVPDATNLLTQLLSGQVDWVDGVAPREAARVKGAPGASLIAFDYPMYDYIGWNGAKPPFDDPAVRRALTLAIDRRAIVDDLLYGYGRVSAGPILSFWWGADPTLEPLPHDPAEARRLLAAAGFSPGPDGVLARGPDRLAFVLTTNAGNRLREAVLVKVQEQLRRIGIEARTEPIEMQTFVERNTSGAFDGYLGGWRFSGKVELAGIFGSAAIPPAGNNVVRYRSAEVDRLLGLLDRAPDWSAMKPLLSEISRKIRDDQPYTFLYETQRLAAAGPRLHGAAVEIPADPLAGLERWWVDADLPGR